MRKKKNISKKKSVHNLIEFIDLDNSFLTSSIDRDILNLTSKVYEGMMKKK